MESKSILALLLIVPDMNLFYPVIIFLLFLYIIYLHYNLRKKDKFIASFLKKMLALEKLGTTEEVKKVLKKLIATDFSFLLPKDKILEEKIMDYIFENDQENMLFIHYTRHQQTAEKIISEGFRFRNSFYKTAENIRKDRIDFINKHLCHKEFGSFVIIIAIAKSIYEKYATKIDEVAGSGLLVEQVLTETTPETDENEDIIYTLPNQYIKGYVDYEKGIICNNPVFNSNYDSDRFIKNTGHSNKRV